MDMRAKTEEYFSTMNPMASRMYVDMNETKLTYESYWEKLDYEEQQQILKESIIKPEIAVKYDLTEDPATDIKYAVKTIVDDNCSYRDEHSAPFTFRTPSQRDLTIFGKSKANEKKACATKKMASSITSNNVDSKNELDYKIDDNVAQNLANVVQEITTHHILPKTGLDLLDNW